MYSKKQREWIEWYQRGTNDWWEAYYVYPARRRRKKMGVSLLPEKCWFNSVLRTLKEKGEFLHVPRAFESVGMIHWVHPGFENNGYVAEVGKENTIHLAELRKPII